MRSEQRKRRASRKVWGGGKKVELKERLWWRQIPTYIYRETEN